MQRGATLVVRNSALRLHQPMRPAQPLAIVASCRAAVAAPAVPVGSRFLSQLSRCGWPGRLPECSTVGASNPLPITAASLTFGRAFSSRRPNQQPQPAKRAARSDAPQLPPDRRAALAAASTASSNDKDDYEEPSWGGPNVRTSDAFLVCLGAGLGGYLLYSNTRVGAWVDALPVSVQGLLAANVAVFAMHYVLPDSFVHRHLTTSWLWLRRGRLHTPFLSTVSQGRPLHLIFNMAFILLLAPTLAQQIGDVQFTAFYLLAGGAAAVADALAVDVLCKGAMRRRLRGQPILGASGAIAAMMGALLITTPLDAPVFPVGIVKVLLPLWLLSDGAALATFLRKTALVPGVPARNLASVAHFTGAIIGIIVGLYLRLNAGTNKPQQPVKPQPPVPVAAGSAPPAAAQ